MSLTKTFSPQQYEEGLESWGWIGLHGKTPVLSSQFGDVFLRGDDGLWFLDSISGTMTREWDDEGQMHADLSTADGQERFLLASLAAAAERAGLALGPDEMYDLKHPPALGGGLDVTNVSVMDFVVAFDIAGQLHEQIRDLAPGTKVSGFSLVAVAHRRTPGQPSGKPAKRRWLRG